MKAKLIATLGTLASVVAFVGIVAAFIRWPMIRHYALAVLGLFVIVFACVVSLTTLWKVIYDAIRLRESRKLTGGEE